MKRKQTLKYIICDVLSAMLAWAALFLFRKMELEDNGLEAMGDVLSDPNFWLGLVVVPTPTRS